MAKAAISVGTTTTGVQPKLSVGIDSHTTTAKLTVVDYPARYIVKPQSPAYAHLLELESVAMTLAQKAQIQTVDFGLLREQGGTLVYITRRVDRIKTPERVRKLT
ncbi:MAG TPA: HipA domain-containing protein, partial [Sphaerochaeta sp.]|nr:HipA domain-containing protein [Sphaerochaeta sp.]